jgi:hypothetical protein
MAQKKKIPFTLDGIRGFQSLNDALKYYSARENGARSQRAIVELYNQAYEFNIGKISVNLGQFKDGTKFNVDKLQDFFKRKKLFQNEKQLDSILQRVKKVTETWNGGKPSDVFAKEA